jgi:hypothetical protein
MECASVWPYPLAWEGARDQAGGDVPRVVGARGRWRAAVGDQGRGLDAHAYADGQPDLQGMWVNFDSTPFEADTSLAQSDVNPPSHWTEHDSPMSPKRRSMVVDPPDGRVPVMKWAEDKRDFDLAHLEDAPWYETPWVRCITRGVPAGCSGGIQQRVPDRSDPRLRRDRIRNDSRHADHSARRAAAPRQQHRLWNGDSRGHFEGNTLIVETTNFNDKGSIATSAATGRIRGIPQSEELHLVERFTRVDASTINYSVTITDPKVYTQSWTVALP